MLIAAFLPFNSSQTFIDLTLKKTIYNENVEKEAESRKRETKYQQLVKQLLLPMSSALWFLWTIRERFDYWVLWLRLPARQLERAKPVRAHSSSSRARECLSLCGGCLNLSNETKDNHLKMMALNTMASLEIGADLPPLPPRFRFRDLILGGGDFFNDDGER